MFLGSSVANAKAPTPAVKLQLGGTTNTLFVRVETRTVTRGDGHDGLVEFSGLVPQVPGNGAGLLVVHVNVPDKRDVVDPGDDYPAELKSRGRDSVQDQWGEYNRECVSFVAWALASRNCFTVPFNDNAIGWGPRAAADGYLVDSTPAQVINPGDESGAGVHRMGSSRRLAGERPVEHEGDARASPRGGPRR